MNETFGDLMAGYEKVRDGAKKFGTWSELDKYVESLVVRIAPKTEPTLRKFQEYAFDDMGLALPLEENND